MSSLSVVEPTSQNQAEITEETIVSIATNANYFDYAINPLLGYVYSLEKADETLKLFQQNNSSRFICYKVQSSFGKDDWSSYQRKILWQQALQKKHLTSAWPEFDGIPYILIGTKIMECQYGVDRNIYQKKRHQERRKVESLDIVDRRHPISKKVDCPAKIIMKDVIKFPSFKVGKNAPHSKKIKSLLLRLALKEGRAEGERRIYIQLPNDGDHHNHEKTPIRRRCRRQRELQNTLKTEPSLIFTSDIEFSDTEFLHTFRVTKSVYQFLLEEWQREELERMVNEGSSVVELEPYDQFILAALYYLGSQEKLSSACVRFKMKAAAYLDAVIKFNDFLIRQREKYLSLPTLEERIRIAEVFKHICGFPGAFGAMNAALIQIKPLPPPEKFQIARTGDVAGYKDTNFVLQFIVDHQLIFRDIHIDSPSTGSRLKVFQESSVWVNLQSLTSSETHIVAPAMYPLAPAIMTPHVTEVLTYQEALFNNNHQEALKLTSSAMIVFKSRFRRMQLLDCQMKNSEKFLEAACVLHNIALVNENETVLDDLLLEYNAETDIRAWHTEGDKVAEFGVLGGKEKRLFLTTVMTPCDGNSNH